MIAPGYKANINVIDHDRLTLHAPEIVDDLPGGGRRLDQRASGYRYMLVSGRNRHARTTSQPGCCRDGSCAAGRPRQRMHLLPDRTK